MMTFVYPWVAQAFIQGHEHLAGVADFYYENYYQTQRALYVADLLGTDHQEMRFRQRTR